jgi:transcriptional regulator with PAS, ATPase and Fis domain
MHANVSDQTKRVHADAAGTIRVPALDLVVVAGPDRGLSAHVTRGAGRIGTIEGCDLRLTDETVSRVHCEISSETNGIAVRDAGSTNGTFVDGTQLIDAVVRPGTLLVLGRTTVRVSVPDEIAFVRVSDEERFGELVGASVAMRRVYATLERVAPTEATILLQGETGAGKDAAARSIHAASKRASSPFVPIDCAAIPETLFESELFGHVRGAFSGAVADRKGVFEEASGGTLFLDEIGEVPLALQAKLLRALESKTIRPVGGSAERAVDVRVIAATNRPLTQAVNDGAFRADLYYRLAVIEVTLPPLRARAEDIPAIARHFQSRIGGEPLPESFVSMLKRRAWPGNVRELRNFIERAASLGLAAPTPVPVDLPADLDALMPLDRPLKEARQAWIAKFEAVYIRSILAKTGGNVTRAAELAGVNRRLLQRMAARLGLRDDDDDE